MSCRETSEQAWVVDGQEDLGPDPDRPGVHRFRPKTRRLLIYSEPQAFKDGYIILLADDAPCREFFGRRITTPDLLDRISSDAGCKTVRPLTEMNVRSRWYTRICLDSRRTSSAPLT